MVSYATLKELEETALKYREDLLGEGKRMDAVAARVGKTLRPIAELDEAVASATECYTTSFELREIPQLWRDFVSLYLPEENVDKWLEDRRAFVGSSPRRKLSELEPTNLKSSVDEVARLFYEVLGFATVPALPSTEQLLYVTRLAQVEQLQSQ